MTLWDVIMLVYAAVAVLGILCAVLLVAAVFGCLVFIGRKVQRGRT